MNWLKKILHPKQLQFKELDIESVIGALNEPVIRKYWIEAMGEKIQLMNMELDALLAKEDKTRIWETLAIERRTLLRCLTLILDTRDKLESERVDQERQNRLHKGTAAFSPIDNRANNPARD